MHAALLAIEEHAEAATGVAPEAVGALALGVLIALLLVTFAFRNVGNRH